MMMMMIRMIMLMTTMRMVMMTMMMMMMMMTMMTMMRGHCGIHMRRKIEDDYVKRVTKPQHRHQGLLWTADDQQTKS